jgi:transcriptional regulator with XRE-family HTH domain
VATSINDRIRLARRHARLSQTKLAEAVGVQRSAVAQWERANGVRPTMENLIKLAVIAGMHLEWLATGRGKMSLPDAGASGDQLTDLQLSEFALNEHEQRILRAFRALDRRSVHAITVLAESLVPSAAGKRGRTPAGLNGG